MKKIEYERMAQMEEHYWWHVGRLKIIENQIKKISRGKKLKILNIGCGTGGTIKMLERYGDVTNVDVSKEAIKFMEKKGFRNTVLVDGIKLPFKPNTFDLVGAFDVLEHIDEDEDAVREWRRVLKRDGQILLTVPAYSWLWSDHDISLHHYRRHTKKTIRSIISNTGCKEVRISYMIVFSLPLVAGFRLLNKLAGKEMDAETSYVKLPGFINWLFTQFLFIEAWAQKYMRFPFGTSLIAQIRAAKK